MMPDEQLDFPPLNPSALYPVHLPGTDKDSRRSALCGAEIGGTQITSQSGFYRTVTTRPDLACTNCLEVVQARGMPTTCRRCYRQRVKMFRRDDRILCSGCLLDVLEHEGLIERIEVRSGL